jgi:hypothetical protein
MFFLANARKKKSNLRVSQPPQREKERKKKPTGREIEGTNKERSGR